MSWSPIHLRGISFLGHSKIPALLEFQEGLNVVCGASDTGKSFIVEAIDFLLGSKTSLKDIPERIGYDRTRLILQPIEQEFVTLETSTSGGEFLCFQGAWLSAQPNNQGTTLRRKHSKSRADTLSHYLLSSIELTDKYLRKNKGGETRTLSFRDIANLIVIKEDEIFKKKSPFLTGQYTNRTVECSVFKLLLTGVDDSALIAQSQIRAEIATTKQSNKAKAELIDELIQELQAGLDGTEVNRSQAGVQLSELNERIRIQQESVNQIQGELNRRLERRREIVQEIEKLSIRINEISGMLQRFDLLQNHYQVDLNRLTAIEESGSLFVHFKTVSCPLCGTPPNEQHQNESCDGNIENVIHAATAEIAKVEKLSIELSETATDMQNEAQDLRSQKEQILPELQSLNDEIEEITAPLRSVQSTFSELANQASEMQQIIDIFDRIESLRQRKQLKLLFPI